MKVKYIIIVFFTMLALGFLFMLTLQQASESSGGDQSESSGGDQSESSGGDQSESSGGGEEPDPEYYTVIVNYVNDDDENLVFYEVYTGDIAIYDSADPEDASEPVAVIEYGESASVQIFSGYICILAIDDSNTVPAYPRGSGFGDWGTPSDNLSEVTQGTLPYLWVLSVSGDGEIYYINIDID